jgi:transcriptional regulator GlxA family with amidase domain
MKPTTPGIGRELHQFMLCHRPYLLHRYSMEQLSIDSKIPVWELSNFIFGKKGMSFRDYIDTYRIYHCKSFLRKLRPVKMSASDLSVICGFPNERAFSACFKKTVHASAGEYIRELRGGKIG